MKALFSHTKTDLRGAGLPLIAVVTAVVLTGGFSEFFSCAVGVVVSALLLVLILRNKADGMEIKLGSSFFAVALIALFYLVTPLYAVDRGMAFLGFVKFLPVVLFAVLLMQKESYVPSLRRLLPLLAATAGLASLLLMAVGAIGFSVAGRMAGFFQYPNSFAAFLMVGALTALAAPDRRLTDLLLAGLLIILILLTGSRAVLVLMVLFAVILLFARRGMSKRARIIAAVCVAVCAAAVVLLYPLLSQNELFSRFFSLSV